MAVASGVLFLGRNELVAEAVDRLYLGRGARLGHLAAQVLHLGVDELEVVGLVGMVAPYGLGQYGLVDQVIGPLHEVEQYVELLFQELYLAPVDRHASLVHVERDVAGLDGQLAAAAAAAQDAAYTCQQLGRVEGLGQVVVGAELETLDLVVERVACRYYDYVVAAAQLLDVFEQAQPLPSGSIMSSSMQS